MSEILKQQIAYYQARAIEYDEWWNRQGRYDKGAMQNTHWRHEGAVVRKALHELPKQDHILELACGTGIWTAELVNLGQKVTAVDASSEMIAINQAKVQSDDLTYIQADLFDWQFDQKVDMIFFSFWLSHVPDDELMSFLNRVSDMLKPKGLLFILDSKRNQVATAHDQDMLEVKPIHTRYLNDGREFQIIKTFAHQEDLRLNLHRVSITAEVFETEQFFLYAIGHKN